MQINTISNYYNANSLTMRNNKKSDNNVNFGYGDPFHPGYIRTFAYDPDGFKSEDGVWLIDAEKYRKRTHERTQWAENKANQTRYRIRQQVALNRAQEEHARMEAHGREDWACTNCGLV